MSVRSHMTRDQGHGRKETRYYIASLDLGVKKFAKASRGHWGIENSLHWVLDVTFNEDQSRMRSPWVPADAELLQHRMKTLRSTSELLISRESTIANEG